jgi:hypothetical protein
VLARRLLTGIAVWSCLGVACSASTPLIGASSPGAAGTGGGDAPNGPAPSGAGGEAELHPTTPILDGGSAGAADTTDASPVVVNPEAGTTLPVDAATTPPPDAGTAPDPRRAKAIAVNGTGPWQACALLTDGTVECWVDGTRMGGPAGAPVLVPGLVGATAIAVGVNKGCAILAGGAVSCWTNTSGVMGNTQPITSATLVPELTGVTSLSLGDIHSCALLAGGQPVCWGYNDLGELGTGTTSTAQTTTPVPVAGLTNVTSIAVGEYHTCAADSKGMAYCWGLNDQDQLGLDQQVDPYAPHPTPMVVPGLSGVASISAGGSSTCALLATGAVDCWGFPTKTVTPIDGFGATRALSVSTALAVSCVVLADGHVACWGDGSHGGLGVGTKTSSSTTALVVPSLTNVIGVGVSLTSRVCALVADGTVSCWGPRTYYSTGITDDDLAPVPVTGL